LSAPAPIRHSARTDSFVYPYSYFTTERHFLHTFFCAVLP
jgi:hypothetical protein